MSERTEATQAKINAIKLHLALTRLVASYKQLATADDVAVEDAERALWDYRPLADWENVK